MASKAELLARYTKGSSGQAPQKKKKRDSSGPAGGFTIRDDEDVLMNQERLSVLENDDSMDQEVMRRHYEAVGGGEEDGDGEDEPMIADGTDAQLIAEYRVQKATRKWEYPEENEGLPASSHPSKENRDRQELHKGLPKSSAPNPTIKKEPVGFAVRKIDRRKQEDQSPPRRGRRDDDRDQSPPRRGRRDGDGDQSPPRRGGRDRDGDQSPPRRGRRDDDRDQSPPRRGGRDGDRDQSPPRRGRRDDDRDQSPPRRGRRDGDGDQSPPRRGRRDGDGDQSPPRRGRRDGDGDQSPSRRGGRDDDGDQSPPRRGGRDRDGDQSPPRRGRGDGDGDQSPPRRGGRDRDGDQSPPRKMKKEEGTMGSPARHNRGDRDEDIPLPRVKEEEKAEVKKDREAGKKKMSSGHSAGLVDAATLRREQEELKRKREEDLEGMDPDKLGRNADVIYRDKQGRKITQEEWQKQNEKKRKREKSPPQKLEWGRGLVQNKKDEDKAAEEARIAAQPLARYDIDDALDMDLKQRGRWGDPLANLGGGGEEGDEDLDPSQTGEGASAAAERPRKAEPRCPHPSPPNRFGIPAGYRWDGQIRGNKYEERWIAARHRDQEKRDEAYKAQMEGI
uniref:BUD13 homolog n=1 Tax=Chromera velia CCMP2878 TaxID=1169474 RepID=A0A0G4F4F0_9ALVE|eukprot:Cvel_15019.t1-p1 / transcript=Cvel_15019.t1 / gene=Cvel_15019 / organism=Chromera_velia_CCMP2878 / gene_product=Pre-mRNA-splicing factor cwf26, putative / transcript_product=Pre-mRNA-splicing factor cwf26, putative / location=Cvel_scaffold1093:10551-15484(+) / protein_length=615 / sequence_SO=supercontig / SO=protein_coding / is_pseudo=false